MALLPKESIKVIAESVGISELADDIAAAMVSDVEYRLREIAQEAIKFMKHSKRDMLTCEDVNNALRLRNVETLYGYSNKAPLHFRRSTGFSNLFYVEDEVTPLMDVIGAEVPKCPRDTTFMAHWLAIEGVQPAIRQNPTAVVAPSVAATEQHHHHSGAPRLSAVDVALGGRGDAGIAVKGLVKHALSQELQLYYDNLTQALLGGEEKLVTNALRNIAEDPGIHQLLPYFVKFISDKITQNLKDLALLTRMVRTIQALLSNELIHVEPYLHHLMPAVLTCLVGKRLCAKASEDHWSLRDMAAAVVADVCKRFGHSYRTLQPRITKTLLHAFLDTSKPLPTQYGAVVGLSKLGHNVVEVLLLPHLEAYFKLLKPALSSDSQVKKKQAKQVHAALLRAAAAYLHEATAQKKAAAAAALLAAEEGNKELGTVAVALPGLEEHEPTIRKLFGKELTNALAQLAQDDPMQID